MKKESADCQKFYQKNWMKGNDMRQIKKYWILALFIIVFMLKGIYYAKDLTPATTGQAPDEVGHVSYIQYIVGEKKLPVLNETVLEFETIMMYCKYQFDYYPERDFMDYKNNTYNFKSSQTVNWIVQHPPVYYVLAAPVYAFSTLFTDSLIYSVIFTRFFSVFLGMLFLITLYAIGKSLKMKDSVIYSLLAFVTFWPQTQYYFATVSCDSMLILLCAVTLLMLIKYTQTDKKRYFWLFVVSCAGVVLTKYTAALVLIPFICYFIWQSIKKYGLKTTVINCLKAAALGIILIGPYFMRNYMLYHDPLAVYVQPSAENSPITSFKIFIHDYHYFDELFSVLCLLIGWRNFIYPITLFKIFIMALVLTALCGYLPKRKWQYAAGTLVLMSGLSWLFAKLFAVEFLSGMFFVSMLMIFVLILLRFIKEKDNDYELFTAGTLFFVFIFFLLQQYEFSSRLGSLRTVHGRYYMIALVPMLYLIANGIEKAVGKYNDKTIVKIGMPVCTALIMIAFEINTIMMCSAVW